MIGKTVSHYKILEKIGGGGMGVVYKAHDSKLKRTVALKFLPPAISSDPEAKERFIHEARAASALDHPNICTIHEIGETDDGQSYIAMACYEGESLKMKIEDRRLTITESIEIAAQMARGLAKAHGKGIVHRDIKPGNVIVTNEGVVKIVDFGLAKLTGQTRMTKTGATVGTIAYMSPEQTRGENVDHRSDIWSFGVVLYEMLTGELPFRGDYEQAVVYSILNEDPQPVTDINNEVPPELLPILDKTLTKEPSQRYADAEELLRDINKILGIEEKLSLDKVIRRSLKKKSVKRALILSISIILIALIGLISWPRVAAPTPVAVIGFQNKTGDPANNYLSDVIPNFLIRSLNQAKELKLTTWFRLKDLMKKLDNRESADLNNEETGFQLCRLGGMDVLIAGFFTRTGDIFSIEVQVMDANSKEFLAGANSTGRGVESIYSQIDDLSQKISKELGIKEETIRDNYKSLEEISTTSTEAMNFYIRGREEFHDWNISRAVRMLRKAVELDTNFVSAYFWLSTVYTYDSSVPQEEKDKIWEKVKSKLDLASPQEREFLVIVTTPQTRRERFEAMQKYVKKYPGDKYGHRFVALDAEILGEEEVYISESKLILEMDPQASVRRMKLATHYAAEGEYEEAIHIAEEGTFADPGDPEPYAALGEIYLFASDLDAAIENYQKAQYLAGVGGREEDIIAYIYALKQDYSQAFKWLKKGINCTGPGRYGFPRSSVNTMNHCWMGFYYVWLGQLDSCMYHLQMAEKLDVENQRLITTFIDELKAWIYIEKGDFDKGRQYIDTSYARCERWSRSIGVPCVNISRFMKTYFYLRSGQPDSADHYIQLITKDLPKIRGPGEGVFTHRYNVLYCEKLLAQDSLVAARQICDKIVFILPNFWLWVNAIQFQLVRKDMSAQIYIKEDRLDKAIEEYQRLLKFQPHSGDYILINPKLYYRIAKLYDQTKQYSAAIEQYTKFLELWEKADEDLPEKIHAQERLAALEKM